MALHLVCDGCPEPTPLTPETARTFGRLSQVFYCADCAGVWEAFLAAERTLRTTLSETYEAWRREELGKLRARGIARLPDE